MESRHCLRRLTVIGSAHDPSQSFGGPPGRSGKRTFLRLAEASGGCCYRPMIDTLRRQPLRHRNIHMTDEILPPAGGYAAAPGWLQYSRGVRALADHAIVRVRFQTPIPLDAGFARIATWLRDRCRPLTSLCACELRSPAQFTEEGFLAFNQRYASTLRAWGVMQGDANPVARSNVIPPIAPPQEPSCWRWSRTAHRRRCWGGDFGPPVVGGRLGYFSGPSAVRLATCSWPSRTLRAAPAGGALRASWTATARDAWAGAGRDDGMAAFEPQDDGLALG
jgi:hypothetical protein